MTLIFHEGFENSADVNCYARKWARFIGVGSFPAGRLHGFAAQTSGTTEWRTRSLGLQNTWVVGFGMQHAGATVIDETDVFPLIVKRGTAQQIHLQWRKGTGNTFKFDVFRGTTLLGSTSDFVAQSWHYFEVKMTIDTGTSGSVEIRHNTQVDLTLSSINTADSGLAGADVFEINVASGVLRFDDIYMLDSTGTINNDYLGDSVVEGRRPTGDSTPSQFTQAGAFSTSWESTESVSCTGSVNNDYIFSSTVGHQDMMSFNALSFITGQIHGVLVNSDAQLDTTGSREFKHIIRSNATLFTSPPGGISHTVASTSFQAFFDMFERDPDTAAKWTIAALDAAEFGVEVVS